MRLAERRETKKARRTSPEEDGLRITQQEHYPKAARGFTAPA
jgi:hypothetical protein